MTTHEINLDKIVRCFDKIGVRVSTISINVYKTLKPMLEQLSNYHVASRIDAIRYSVFIRKATLDSPCIFI